MMRSMALPRPSVRSQHLPLPAGTNRRSNTGYAASLSSGSGIATWILMVPVCFFFIGIAFCAWWVWSHPSSSSLTTSPSIPSNTIIPDDDGITSDQYTAALHRLDATIIGYPGLFVAGQPRFTRLFTRDIIISAMLMGNDQLLRTACDTFMVTQGTSVDARSGREPGKIIHELPGVTLDRGLRTDYSASDTTALYLLGIIHYWRTHHDRDWLDGKRASIVAALEYIMRHMDDHAIWWEDPSYAGGAKRYALKVTYWKDSSAWDRPDGRPIYPVAYAITQAAYFAAVRGVSQLPFGDDLIPSMNLVTLSNNMLTALITRFWRDQSDGSAKFVTGIDQRGDLSGTASDSLHLLWYLEVGDISDSMLLQLEHGASSLISPIGYRSLAVPKDGNGNTIPAAARGSWYHGIRAVWPFEQAVIHQAATKFSMVDAAIVSLQMKGTLDSIASSVPLRYDIYPELMTFIGHTDHVSKSNDGGKVGVRPVISMEPKKPSSDYTLVCTSGEFEWQWLASGDNPQLWTMAAAHYFARLPPAVQLATPTSHATLPPLPHDTNIDDNRNHAINNEQSTVVPPMEIPCELPYGARPHDLHVYCAPSSRWQPLTWTCKDGHATIEWSRINDDYCDCDDGSDEPGTAACSLIQSSFGFYCGPGKTKHIHLSQVNDGICDCCDGNDETTTLIAGKCPKKC